MVVQSILLLRDCETDPLSQSLFNKTIGPNKALPALYRRICISKAYITSGVLALVPEPISSRTNRLN